jgi:hypothetical protein
MRPTAGWCRAGVAPPHREHRARGAQAMAEAGLDYPALDAVAVTQGPGLVGSLLVGCRRRRRIAFVHGKPLVAVHHIAGHLQAPFLAAADIPLPALALVVSGGHTSLFEMDARGLPAARADARRRAGEAFDKVAKLLGLGYPGADHRSPRPRAPTTGVDFTVRASRTARRFLVQRLKTAVLLPRARAGIGQWPRARSPPSVVRTSSPPSSGRRSPHSSAEWSARPRGSGRRACSSPGASPPTAAPPRVGALGRDPRAPALHAAHRLSTDNAAMIGAAGFLAFERENGSAGTPTSIPSCLSVDRRSHLLTSAFDLHYG